MQNRDSNTSWYQKSNLDVTLFRLASHFAGPHFMPYTFVYQSHLTQCLHRFHRILLCLFDEPRDSFESIQYVVSMSVLSP